jgi:hypothetical protein
MWSSGDPVLVRRLLDGRIWYAASLIAVRDDPEALVLWQPPEAVHAKPVGELFGDWELDEGSHGEEMLRLMPSGRAHAILHFFRPDGSFLGWYVNLETSRRTPLGLDVDDHFLDVWITADGTVEWLDEDELAEAAERGLISQNGADAARAEGERVLAEWPFPTGWEDFRPLPEWVPPPLPEGWDVV